MFCNVKNPSNGGYITSIVIENSSEVIYLLIVVFVFLSLFTYLKLYVCSPIVVGVIITSSSIFLEYMQVPFSYISKVPFLTSMPVSS